MFKAKMQKIKHSNPPLKGEKIMLKTQQKVKQKTRLFQGKYDIFIYKQQNVAK